MALWKLHIRFRMHGEVDWRRQISSYIDAKVPHQIYHKCLSSLHGNFAVPYVSIGYMISICGYVTGHICLGQSYGNWHVVICSEMSLLVSMHWPCSWRIHLNHNLSRRFLHTHKRIFLFNWKPMLWNNARAIQMDWWCWASILAYNTIWH